MILCGNLERLPVRVARPKITRFVHSCRREVKDVLAEDRGDPRHLHMVCNPIVKTYALLELVDHEGETVLEPLGLCKAEGVWVKLCPVRVFPPLEVQLQSLELAFSHKNASHQRVIASYFVVQVVQEDQQCVEDLTDSGVDDVVDVRSIVEVVVLVDNVDDRLSDFGKVDQCNIDRQMIKVGTAQGGVEGKNFEEGFVSLSLTGGAAVGQVEGLEAGQVEVADRLHHLRVGAPPGRKSHTTSAARQGTLAADEVVCTRQSERKNRSCKSCVGLCSLTTVKDKAWNVDPGEILEHPSSQALAHVAQVAHIGEVCSEQPEKANKDHRRQGSKIEGIATV